MKKFILLFGVGVGFVLGSRAGREPYRRLTEMARDLTQRREFKRLASTVSDQADSLSKDTVDKVTSVTEMAHDKFVAATDRATEKVADITGTGKNGSQKKAPAAQG